MFQSNWPRNRLKRPAYFKPITHQTLIGKALFEHSRECSTAAAVAGVSPNFRNSSLGPNLLALVEVNDENHNLFLKVFFSHPDSTTLQFTNAIFVDQRYYPQIGELLVQNLCQTKYFGMNDLCLQLFVPVPSVVRNLFHKCKKLVNLTVNYTNFIRSDQPGFSDLENAFRFFDGSRLKRLSLKLNVLDALRLFNILYERSPNLEELTIKSSADLASNIFSMLAFQDIEDNNGSNINNATNNTIQTHHPHLTSLSLYLDTDYGTLDHSAFQNIFCGVLLQQQDQLRHLSLDFNSRLNQDDWSAFNSLTLNNLIMNESPWGILPRQCLGNSIFDDVKVVEVKDFSDADLVHLGNQCLLMEDLKIDFDYGADCAGAFLSDPSLVPEAYNQVRSLSVSCYRFTTDSMGDGFSRFKSLEKLTLMFPRQADVVAAFLQHLANPHLLKYLKISGPSPNAIASNFFSAHVSKFSNLEVFDLNCHTYYGEKLEITEEELIHLASLKKLKEISFEFKLSHDSRCFSSSSIIRVVEQLPNLNRLHVEYCCNFTEDSIKKLLAHRSLQDLSVGPVLMVKSDLKNKTAQERSIEAGKKEEALKQFVREKCSHISTFKCSVSTWKFVDPGCGGRRQRNEDQE